MNIKEPTQNKNFDKIPTQAVYENSNQNKQLSSPIKPQKNKLNFTSKNLQINSVINNNELTPSVILTNSRNNYINHRNITYGIDESGNPMNIRDYYKSINDSVYSNTNTSIFSGLTSTNNKLKRPIAYITKDEKGNNILMDLKGNIITNKNKEGDFVFPLELHVIVKDFDVKHPELRVNGERYYDEKIEIEKAIDEFKIDKNDLNNYIEKNMKFMNVKFNKSAMKELIHRNISNENSNKHIKKINKDKILLRTYDVLKLKNSKSPDENNRVNNYKFNYINLSGNAKKPNIKNGITKNRSFISSRTKNNIKYLQSSSSYKYLKLNENLKNIFCLKNQNKKRNLYNNKIYNDFNIFKTSEPYIKKNNNQTNKINNIYKLENSKRNNIDKNKTYKYFIMQPNPISNNKSFNKNNCTQENNKRIKRIDKNKIITKKKKNKNNIFIDINQTNRIYNKNKVNINNNINITNSFISRKIKTMALNQNNKNNKIIKSERYYILSEEANNMIKSYSKSKILKGKKYNDIGRNKYKLTYNNSSVNFINS